MIRLQRAVFFMEEEPACPADSKPLMLKAVLSCPILSWMSNQLLADGVQRFFLACDDRFAEEARKCFPVGAEVTVSNRHDDLLAFLDTEEQVAVLPRSAIPMAEAGAGFAYAAPGRELREVWKDKMTNAVSGAELLPGWLPVYSQETIDELEPLLRERAKRSSGENA